MPNLIIIQFILMLLAPVHKVLQHFSHPVHLPAILVQLPQIFDLCFVSFDGLGLHPIDVGLAPSSEQVRAVELLFDLLHLHRETPTVAVGNFKPTYSCNCLICS
jgi:hypothetical protein